MTNYREDQDLINVLKQGSNEDIAILIDIITDSGKGRISLDNEVKDILVNAKTQNAFNDSHKEIIAAEIQKFGGNSLVSVFRGGKGVLYREIAGDVADHVSANYNNKNDISQIESAILLKIVEKSLEKMTEAEKKQFFEQFGVQYIGVGPAAMMALINLIGRSVPAYYRMTTIIAQATARALLGKGVAIATTGGVMRGASVLAGPIGWAITGIWTAFDLASPAYRISVPCVIQLAYMRQQALICECPSCHVPITKGIKFCSECGHKL